MTCVVRMIVAAALAVAVGSAQGGALFGKDDVEKERKEIQEARANALASLYEANPKAKQQIAQSRGYAVFSNMGVNLILLSTQRGGGVLRDNRSGKDTYMRMLSAGGGVGLGVKQFAAIFIFHTDAALDGFREDGWDFSAQADANLESADQGEGMETAATVMPGTTLYQITEAGVAAQVTLQGTKFWADDDLN